MSIHLNLGGMSDEFSKKMQQWEDLKTKRSPSAVLKGTQLKIEFEQFNRKIRRCGNDTTLHQRPNDIEDNNYRSLYRLQQ